MNLNLGVFSDRENADAAIDELEAAGFSPKEMSVILKNEEGSIAYQDKASAIAQDTASGAATGGVIGGLAGLLIGLGAIAIPGIGPLLVGGPIAAALGLTGAAAATVSGAVTGALAGGLVGALVGLGVPEETAKVYEETVRAGGVLLAVPETAASGKANSREILERNNADQVHTVGVDDNR